MLARKLARRSRCFEPASHHNVIDDFNDAFERDFHNNDGAKARRDG
jgi:hypothetical protein